MASKHINEEKEQVQLGEDLHNPEHQAGFTEEKDDAVDKKAKFSSPDYQDKYIRLLAEYTNAMKQKEVELKSMAQFGNKNLLLKVVDILDDIEIGLTQENIHEETKNILEILRSKLHHLLSLEGVTEVELQAGDQYDASKCEVVSAIPDEENKNKILQVVRKGYTLSDKVLRSAKVIVGK